MQPLTFTLTGTSTAVSKVIPLDTNRIAAQITIQAVPAGGATYSVRGTAEQPQTYFALDTYTLGGGQMDGASTAQVLILSDEPTAALVFSLPANATGSVKFTVLQQGIQ